MTPERWEKVGEIFNSAVEKDAAERDEYLREECGDDLSLRAEVESLLAAGQGAGRFISEPVAGNFVTDFADHIAALSPGSSIGHYQIGEAIGSGGMGEVYLATDTKLGRKVALKTLPPSLVGEPSFLRRFRNEAQAAANINHPNVATVYSVEEFDGIHFLTMEFIEGKTLDKLTPEGGLDVKTFLDWLEPISQALAAAHKRGIIHRDIKPGNLMISGVGTPKVLDFGLAQFERTLAGVGSVANDITAPGQIIGTPSYMSPEQAEGADVDVRSDIFSFGTVMYEALTGKRPFRGESQGLIVKAVIHADPKPIKAYRADVPDTLTRMVELCLQKSPGKRFQSMREISSILKEARNASDAGVSMDSFARRFYREATSPSKLWLGAAGGVITVLALSLWWYIPRTQDHFQIKFENMKMRRFSDANNVGYAQIAPDGKSVAYATADDDGTRALWIRRLEDRNPLLLVPPQRDYYWGGLAISNDAGQVFYLTAGRAASFGTLYRVSSLGGPSRKLVETVNDVGGVSPDGDRILLVRYGEPTTIISVNTADGGDERVILESPRHLGRGVSFRDPKFAPDGRSVYYIRSQNIQGVESWTLESVSIENGEIEKIYTQSERISEIAVLPDSSGLVYTGVDKISNLQQVFYISLTNRERSRVTNDLHFYFGVNIDREGKTILASQRSSEQQVWVGDATTPSSMKATIHEPLPYLRVDWTPDGRIVYDGYENNVVQVWIADPDGTNRQKLTSAGSDSFEPQVSPDGRYIVFTSKRAGHRQVWRMNIDGGGQTLLADVPGFTQLPRFIGNSDSVVFEWINEEKLTLGRVSVEGGPVEEFLKPNNIPVYNKFYWAISPDGGTIAHSIWAPQDQKMKIAVRPINQVEPASILDIWPSSVFKWSPDGKNIIYRERDAGYQPENVILEVNVATGKSRTVFSAGVDYTLDLSYSPDRRKIAVMTGHTSSNAVLFTSASEAR